MLPARVRAALLALPSPRCAYVYDRAVLVATARRLRAALPRGTELLYAVKANGHPAVLAALATTVDGFEVASGGELALARAAGTRTGIVFGGPAKTDAELAAAVAAGVTVNAESELELRRLAHAARAAGTTATVALRVNRPDAPVPAGSHRMTGAPTPFGLDPDRLAPAVAQIRAEPALRLVGFALHAVSNNLDAAAHAAFVADAVAWSRRQAHQLDVNLTSINVGGGLGVDHAGPGRFDLAAFRTGLARVELPPGARLVVEPGRYLTAAAGWYAAEVLDLKRTHGRWFAVLRGGTHHFRLPAAWGYSHPFTVLPVPGWPHPYGRPGVRDVPVDAVGELCTPRDVLTRDQPVRRLRVGDVLVFGHAGAYGWDISHHDFLRHERPAFLLTGAV